MQPEREISINAPIDRVGALVSEPGWWINDGTVVPHRIEERDEHIVVTDDTHGDFALEVVESHEPDRIVFRWPGVREADDETLRLVTTVTLTLEQGPDAVVVQVVETGFASEGTNVSDAARQRGHADNASGWETELAAARTHLEAG